MTLYPLRFEPLLRRYIWGGRRFATSLQKPLPPGEDYAESWELVDRREVQSMVRFGALQGGRRRPPAARLQRARQKGLVLLLLLLLLLLLIIIIILLSCPSSGIIIIRSSICSSTASPPS